MADGFISQVVLPNNYTYDIKSKILGYYGTSSIDATTAVKTVDCPNFTLSAGQLIAVKFTYGNTSTSTLKLNVNTTGDITIYVQNAATSSTNTLFWDAGQTLLFMYDGTYFRYITKDMVPLTYSQIQTLIDNAWATNITNADITSY